MIAVITINKLYYDQIKNGLKKIDYRNNSLYYQRLFSKNINKIKFHYYKPEYIIKNVLLIELINIPEFLKNSACLKTDKVWAIHLGEEIYTHTYIKEI